MPAVTSSSSDRPFTVLVEGNIGSGKSTFLEHFNKFQKEVDVLTEPVSKWQDVKGHNLLQLMYDDPSRWSLTFQSYVQLTMMELHVKKTEKRVKMIERSLFSARRCFVENLYRSGKMPSSEYSVLLEWYSFLRSATDLDKSVDLIVYLRTTPEIAWQRVKARARSEEKVIPIEYLRELHDLHESWLLNGEAGDTKDLPAPVLVIDANQDMADVPDIYSKHEKAVMGGIRAAKEDDEENADPTPNVGAKTGAVAMAYSPRKVLADI